MGATRVQYAGSPSWRFSEVGSQLVTVALFVRDAAGLAVPSAPDNPPRLAADIPDRSGVLGAGDHAAAGVQWLSWWRQILDHQVQRRRRREDAEDARTRVRRGLADLQQISDPPEFTALVDRPQLRVAVAELFAEACKWENATAPRTPGGRERFDWGLLRQVADDVAFERQVSPDALDANAVVLAVEGAWWHRYAPGGVLCSVAAVADQHVREVIVRDAFESNLESGSA